MNSRARLSDIIAAGTPLAEWLRTLNVSPDRFVGPGETVRAHISFTNIGGAPARGLRVRFPSPVGLTYVPGSATLDDVSLTVPDDVSALVHEDGLDIGTVAPGVVRRIGLAYTVDALIEDGTPIDLQAALISDDIAPFGSNIVRLCVRSRPELRNASRLTLTPSTQATPGGEVIVSARITNTGQSSATDVVIMLPTPLSTGYVPHSAAVDDAPLTDSEAPEPFGFAHPRVVAQRLAPGATIAASYRARIDTSVADTTQIAANGWISCREQGEFELEPAALSVTAPVNVDGEGTRFEVLLDGVAAHDVAPGQRLLCRLSAENVGLSTAHDVVGHITLPAGLLYSPGSLMLDGKPYPGSRRAPTTCHFGDILPGRTAVMSLDAVVASPALHDTALRLQAHLGWEQGADRLFERSVKVVSQPRFDPSRNALTRVGPATVSPDSEVAYALTILNDGTAVVDGAVLAIDWGPGLGDVSLHEGGEPRVLRGRTLTLGTLAPQHPRNFTVRARATAPQTDGTVLRLSAKLTGHGAVELDLGEQCHTVRSRPRLSVESTGLTLASDGPLRYNDLADVAITVCNAGDDVARNVRVELELGEELLLEGVSDAAVDANAVGFGDVGAACTRSAVARVRLRKRLPDRTAAWVNGWAMAQGSPPTALTALAIPVAAQANLVPGASLRSEPAPTVNPGDRLAYTLSLRNGGDGSAAQLALKATLASQTTYVAGSMSINGTPLHDSTGKLLFESEAGLQLVDVAPDVEVTVRWSTTVANPLAGGTVLVAQAHVVVDDAQPFIVRSADVTVRHAPAFPAGALRLPFAIAGMAAAAAAPKPNDPASPAPSTAPPLDREAVPANSPVERMADSSEPTGGAQMLPLPPQAEPPSDGPVSPSRPEGAGGPDRVAHAPQVDHSAAATGTRTSETRDRDSLSRASARVGPARSAGDLIQFKMQLTPARIGAIVKTSRESSRRGGFLPHIFSTWLFLTDGLTHHGPAVDSALATQNATIRGALKRILLRMWLPRFSIQTADIEDIKTRASCQALFAALGDVARSEAQALSENDCWITGEIERGAALGFAAQLDESPLGSATPWLALAHLIGTECVGGNASDALSEYRDALLATLAVYEHSTPAQFQQALAHETDPALDTMLERLLTTLDPQAVPTGA